MQMSGLPNSTAVRARNNRAALGEGRGDNQRNITAIGRSRETAPGVAMIVEVGAGVKEGFRRQVHLQQVVAVGRLRGDRGRSGEIGGRSGACSSGEGGARLSGARSDTGTPLGPNKEVRSATPMLVLSLSHLAAKGNRSSAPVPGRAAARAAALRDHGEIEG